jgi:hypothetical protein
MVESIICNLADYDPFWTSSIDCCGKLSIDPIVKILAAMKLVYYGVSFSAFHDYYQMGESTSRMCLEKRCQGIVKCPNISEQYLRSPSKSDSRTIVSLHKRVYGIDECLGSIDVTKIHWSACPVAWKGQFEGKEGYPTLGLEAVVDHNLWIWHNAFGFAGALNDINIRDRSPLYESGDNTIVGYFYTTTVRESILKYKFAQEHWKKTYSAETSLRLQDAVKKHVYKQHFGDDGTLNGEDMAEDYALSIF